MKQTNRMYSRLLATLLIVTSLLGAMPAQPVYAAPVVYLVNQLADPGDGICDSTCTLRDAILAANANANISPETDTIKFVIGGIISPATPLPNINGNLVIDGTGFKVTINGNNAKRVFYVQAGIVVINNLTIQNGYTGSMGGGIFNPGGTLTVTNSTFTGNKAGYGGAIASSGPTTIANSTFYNNQATVNGGGAYNSAGPLTILNSTFSGNTAASSGGGLYNDTGATLNLGNTIVANSTSGGDCANIGAIGSNTANLIEDGSCPTTLSGPPKLNALSDYGGYTKTMSLQADSPARDVADTTICAAAPVSSLDQRGAPRDLLCDIGAFEATGISTLSIYPNPLNFGERTIGTTSLPKLVTVTYAGTESITFSEVTVTSGETEFSLVEPVSCSYAALNPDISFCTFSVVFHPTSLGIKSGTVTIFAYDHVTPLGVLSLTGTGTQPIVGLSVTSLTFPPTFVNTTSASKLVKITNIGTGTLILNQILTSGDFIVHSNKCNYARLPALGYCTFKVAFSPYSPGTQNGEVIIKSNAKPSVKKILLTGSTKPGTQLLKNGNFDNGAFPRAWIVSAEPSTLVRLPDCTTFRTPFCSAKFTGSIKHPLLSAMQVVTRTGSAGDSFQIGLSSLASKVALGGEYKVVVGFYGSTGIVGTTTLRFSNGTHNYQTLSAVYVAPAPYNRILYNIIYQKTTGTAWFDDAMLILLP